MIKSCSQLGWKRWTVWNIMCDVVEVKTSLELDALVCISRLVILINLVSWVSAKAWGSRHGDLSTGLR